MKSRMVFDINEEAGRVLNAVLPGCTLSTECFFTGSRAFGNEKRNSDWDFCFHTEDRGAVVSALKTRGYPCTPSNYNNGLKCLHKGKTVNFIFLSPVDFKCWATAAYIIRSGAFNLPPCKEQMYALHESLAALAKMYGAGYPISKENSPWLKKIILEE